MNDAKPVEDPSYPLTELCMLADLPARTVRYYVQLGLVDRPVGETRAARYGPKHLEQLLQIRKWSAAGVSLERIRELLHGAPPPVPPPARAAGTVSVRSHVMVTDGVEIVVDPARAGLTPEAMRRFVRRVVAAFDEVASGEKDSNQERKNEDE